MATTTLDTLLPTAATMPIASTNSGKAMMVSISRPTTRSVQPPRNPASAPAAAPTTKDSATAETAIARSSRAATITRDSTSRPTLSVPNGCAREGACSAAAATVRSGGYGASAGPNTARSSSTASSPKASTVSRLPATTRA